jgi:hypothetical protein
VEATRHLVATAAELATGVKDGVHDFEGVLSRRVLADRDAAAIVLDDDHPIGLDRHADRRRVACHRLVDRIIDDLPDEVVEPTLVGRADVHAGAAADGLQALEDLDACRGVVGTRSARLPAAACGGHARILRRFLGHAAPPVNRSYRRPSSSSL